MADAVAAFVVPSESNTSPNDGEFIVLNPVPDVPLVPEVPDEPFVPDVPLVPDVPEVPDVPNPDDQLDPFQTYIEPDDVL